MSVLVGKKAPDFTAPAVLPNSVISDSYNFYNNKLKKYAVAFFYPLDFTFVCPTELLALNKMHDEFVKLNVEVVGISVDSQFTHNAWRNTDVKNGGIGKIKYTLVSDINHEICNAYGIEHPTAKIAMRAAFIIDADNNVVSQIVNDLPIGRNIHEIIRTIQAIQFHKQNGTACPANWQNGKASIKPTPSGITDYLSNYIEEI